MPLSYRVRHLPLHQPLTLVAQTGARSSAAWCVVGTLVRTPKGLNARFLDSAMVCEPAWQACRESVALGAETPCRFGVLTDTGVTIIGEGPVTLTELVAGAHYANQVEHKLHLVVKNCRDAEAILVIEDLGMLLGATRPSAESVNVITMITPYLRSGALRIIATVDPEGWKEMERRRPGFARPCDHHRASDRRNSRSWPQATDHRRDDESETAETPSHPSRGSSR